MVRKTVELWGWGLELNLCIKLRKRLVRQVPKGLSGRSQSCCKSRLVAQPVILSTVRIFLSIRPYIPVILAVVRIIDQSRILSIKSSRL